MLLSIPGQIFFAPNFSFCCSYLLLFPPLLFSCHTVIALLILLFVDATVSTTDHQLVECSALECGSDLNNLCPPLKILLLRLELQ